MCKEQVCESSGENSITWRVLYDYHNKQRLFPEIAKKVGFYNGKGICSLWGKNWSFIQVYVMVSLQRVTKIFCICIEHKKSLLLFSNATCFDHFHGSLLGVHIYMCVCVCECIVIYIYMTKHKYVCTRPLWVHKLDICLQSLVALYG
jgi:hypothetical protein